MSARTPLPRIPRRLDQIPGRDSGDDTALAMILALTSELAVTRARLDTCERLLIAAGVLSSDAVETFVPGAAAIASRADARRRTIAKVLRPMRENAERDLLKQTAKQNWNPAP